jgi:hypothetical protein
LYSGSSPLLDWPDNGQLKGYTRADSPATRVKPIPFTTVDYTNLNANTTQDKATADIATIGFFFLPHPGEHTHSTSGSDTQPFRLQDVTFRLGASTDNAATGPLHLISLATFVPLTFAKQKMVPRMMLWVMPVAVDIHVPALSLPIYAALYISVNIMPSLPRHYVPFFILLQPNIMSLHPFLLCSFFIQLRRYFPPLVLHLLKTLLGLFKLVVLWHCFVPNLILM